MLKKFEKIVITNLIRYNKFAKNRYNENFRIKKKQIQFEITNSKKKFISSYSFVFTYSEKKEITNSSLICDNNFFLKILFLEQFFNCVQDYGSVFRLLMRSFY